MMYEELVKALRCCATNLCDSEQCKYFRLGMDNDCSCIMAITGDAAAAIEALQRELNLAEIAADDNGRQVEKLQAEVKRLKDANDELREAQTYIDHYGDKWMTSAKDVPTSAYNHGYMDGKGEAEAAQPHWVKCDEALPEI